MNWKRAWGNVPGNRYVLYLVLYAGYMVIKSCQKSSNLTLKIYTVHCILIIVQLKSTKEHWKTKLGKYKYILG